MVTVAELGLAHGKSMAACEDVQLITLSERGVDGDRVCMWVEAQPHENTLYHRGEVAEPGQFLSMREDLVLTQVVPTLESDGISLRTRGSDEKLFVPRAEDVAANRIPVSVWGWKGEAIDQGNEAAEWGAEVIGRPVRLVTVSDEAPRYVEGDPRLGRVGFADAYAVTVGSTTSLEHVNEQLRAAGQLEISARRPRVTMLLNGLVLPNRHELPENVFPEDYIKKITITGSGLSLALKRMKACGRCPIPDTNEFTGVRKGAPVRQALGRLARNGRHNDTARYGTKPELFWTQYFIIELPEGLPKGATIDVARGAEVEVTYSDDTNWS